MSDDAKYVLHRYLRVAREAVRWKLDGLDEYDVRRPMTATGTNLLGLVKHLATVEAGYLGAPFGRPFPGPLVWDDEGAEQDADMWARADESRADVLAFHERAGAHADATITAAELDAVGEVPWWPEERRHPSLHTVLVHVVAEVNRHAGHADILRETIDGSAGFRRDSANLSRSDDAGWQAYLAQVEQAARVAAGRAS
jgi:uncharacterized damage-inducible protein DinB